MRSAAAAGTLDLECVKYTRTDGCVESATSVVVAGDEDDDDEAEVEVVVDAFVDDADEDADGDDRDGVAEEDGLPLLDAFAGLRLQNSEHRW